MQMGTEFCVNQWQNKATIDAMNIWHNSTIDATTVACDSQARTIAPNLPTRRLASGTIKSHMDVIGDSISQNKARLGVWQVAQ